MLVSWLLGTLLVRVGIGLVWVVGSFWGFSVGRYMGLSFFGGGLVFFSLLSFIF